MSNDAPATPASIRAALIEQLHQAVAARAVQIAQADRLDRNIATAAGMVPVGTFDLQALAEALRAVDQVAVVERQTAGRRPPFDVEALAAELWHASQEAGGSTSVGDAIVAKLREAVPS